MSQGIKSRERISYQFFDNSQGVPQARTKSFNERLNTLRASAARMNSLSQPTNSPRLIYYIWSEAPLYDIYKISIYKSALDLLFLAPTFENDKINKENILAEMQKIVTVSFISNAVSILPEITKNN